MRRAVVLVALCLLAPCTTTQVHEVTPDELPAGLYAEGRGMPDTERTRARVILFMLEGNRLERVARTGTSDMRPEELVLRALLSGPTSDELAEGLRTALPPAVELTSVSVGSRVADVDLNAAFETADREEHLRRVAQVVYTLSELDGIDSVRFFTDGQLLTVIDQNGDPHDDAVARARYSRFAPRNPLGDPVATGPLRIDVRGDAEDAVP
jgi:hypothetical protein